jgi:hypothetical protein
MLSSTFSVSHLEKKKLGNQGFVGFSMSKKVSWLRGKLASLVSPKEG